MTVSNARSRSFATQAAIASVSAYQQYLSPLKGFSCPHRLLYGGESCSDYVKRVLLHQDLSTAIRLAPQRFQSCYLAAQTFKQKGGCIVIPCCIPL